jgi:RimJ/RimL family protein N-acetyltransferase
MTPFFLRSTRLGFRTWTEDDLDLALKLWGDARVTRFVGGPFTKAQVSERLAKEIATQASHGIQYWPTFLLEDGAHVGCCGLKPHRMGDDVLEIGLYLRPEYWGRGYGAESSRAVMAHAFGTLGVRALFAGHHPDNAESKRVLLGVGFRYSHHEHYPPTGLEHPGYLITRADLERAHGAAGAG